MRKFTLLLMTFVAMAMNASTTETTLWNGTYSDGVELNSETVATFAAGDVLRVYVTVPESGANFKIVYKGESNSWAETTIPSIDTQWPWVNGGDTYYDLTFTSADITALSGMNIYIYKGDNSTIDKVTLITEEEEEEVTYTDASVWTGSTSTGDWSTNIDLASWTVSTELANARMNDVIRIAYTIADEYPHVCIANASGWAAISEGDVTEDGNYDYTIDAASDLEKIQQNGILVRGKNITITAVTLRKASTRYDAVPLTIGSDGVCTFGSSKSLDFSDFTDVAVPYYASEVATGSVTLTSATATRAWTGYIVKGTEGEYSIPVTDSAPEWIDAFNNLKYGSDYDNSWVYRSCYDDTNYRYIFAKDASENIGFFKLATDYSRVTTTTDGEGDNAVGTTVYYHKLAAHQAYLQTASDVTPTTSARVALIFNDDVTAIQGVQEAKVQESGVYYNLSGQRIAKPAKGLYIKDGKKYMAK